MGVVRGVVLMNHCVSYVNFFLRLIFSEDIYRRVRDLEANILIWAMRFENTILKFGIKKWRQTGWGLSDANYS